MLGGLSGLMSVWCQECAHTRLRTVVKNQNVLLHG